MTRIFVSYSHVDRPDVEELVLRLRKVYGHDSVWMDNNGIGGDSWWEETLERIAACKIFLYMLSNEALKSPYCQAEYKEAYRLHKRIVAVQIRDHTRLTDELAEPQYVNMIDWERDTDQLSDLYRALRNQKGLVRHTRYTGRTLRPSVPDAEGEQSQFDDDQQTASRTLPQMDPQQRIAQPSLRQQLAEQLGIRQIWINVASGVIVFIILAFLTYTVSSLLGEDFGSKTPTSPPRLTADSAETLMPQEVANAAIPSETASDTLTTSMTQTPIVASNITPTPHNSVALAERGVETNTNWATVVQVFDGVEMVLVPTGCFMMGSEGGSSDGLHEVCIERSFWIDRYEVTQEQFDAFGGQAKYDSGFSGVNRPRENIDWFEARNYCELRRARLPTEAEWEYAARGPDSLVYPWGDEFDGTRLNFCDLQCNKEFGYDWADLEIDDDYSGTAPVGSYEAGISWVGAYDLSGNVWEWINTIYADYPYDSTDGREFHNDTNSDRVLRGGSFDNTIYYSRAALRVSRNPDNLTYGVGFRCARSP